MLAALACAAGFGLAERTRADTLLRPSIDPQTPASVRRGMPPPVQASAVSGPDDAVRLRGSLPGDDITGALPAPGLERAPGLSGEGLFGSVELPVRTTVASARWYAILSDGPSAYFEACAPGQACTAPLHKAFEAVKAARPPGLSLELLRDVNAAVNRSLAFRSDDEIWGMSDYWASPAESASKGAGDCEDFAIAKFGMLQAMGVPTTAMRIAVVKDVRKGIGHALLVVRAGGVSWVLDNQAADVRPDTAVAGYMPLYSLGIDGAWVHGFRRPGPVSSGEPTRSLALRPSLN